MKNHSASFECLARVSAAIHKWSTPPPATASPGFDPDHEVLFDELARDLFAHQFQRNPVLRRFCESRGVTPASLGTWRDVPALPASAFKDFEVTILPGSERTVVFHSSGTTGQRPSRHFHSAASLALYETSLLAWFRPHLLGDPVAAVADRGQLGVLGGLAAAVADRGHHPTDAGGLTLLSLTPPPVKARHSSLVHMMKTVRLRFAWTGSMFLGKVAADQTWTLDRKRLVEALEHSVQIRTPVAVLGTALGFVEVLDHLEACRLEFRLPTGSRVMETGGYKGRSRSLSRPELQDRIERFLGIPAHHIISEYGMSELGSQAYDSHVPPPGEEVPRRTGFQPVAHPNQPSGTGRPAPDRLFRFPPWARVRLISPETGREVGEGETGLIRVCDLANVCSVIALQTEDLGVRRRDGFELLGRAAQAEPRGCSLTSP